MKPEAKIILQEQIVKLTEIKDHMFFQIQDSSIDPEDSMILIHLNDDLLDLIGNFTSKL